MGSSELSFIVVLIFEKSRQKPPSIKITYNRNNEISSFFIKFL